MQNDFLRNMPPLPEFKNYGQMIENIETRVATLDTVLREMVDLMREQNTAIETIFKSNQELHEKLRSFTPVNN